MHLKMLSVKWRQVGLMLNVIIPMLPVKTIQPRPLSGFYLSGSGEFYANSIECYSDKLT